VIVLSLLKERQAIGKEDSRVTISEEKEAGSNSYSCTAAGESIERQMPVGRMALALLRDGLCLGIQRTGGQD
jgi:hypothetical protein